MHRPGPGTHIVPENGLTKESKLHHRDTASCYLYMLHCSGRAFSLAAIYAIFRGGSSTGFTSVYIYIFAFNSLSEAMVLLASAVQLLHVHVVHCSAFVLLPTFALSSPSAVQDAYLDVGVMWTQHKA